jgi:Tfp pilus assembly protein PilO
MTMISKHRFPDLGSLKGLGGRVSKMSKDDKQKLVLMGLLIAGVCFVAFQFLLGPGLNRLKAGKMALAEWKAKVTEGREMIRDRDRIQRIATESTKKLSTLMAWIPNEADSSWVLKLISDVARQQNIRTVSIKPVKEEDQAQAGVYKILSCQIELKTDYHSFGRFLDQLERQSPYLLVRDINIESSVEDDSVQEISLKIHYFVTRQQRGQDKTSKESPSS